MIEGNSSNTCHIDIIRSVNVKSSGERFFFIANAGLRGETAMRWGLLVLDGRLFFFGVDKSFDGSLLGLFGKLADNDLADFVDWTGDGGLFFEYLGDMIAEFGLENIAYPAFFHVEHDFVELRHHLAAGEKA